MIKRWIDFYNTIAKCWFFFHYDEDRLVVHAVARVPIKNSAEVNILSLLSGIEEKRYGLYFANCALS